MSFSLLFSESVDYDNVFFLAFLANLSSLNIPFGLFTYVMMSVEAGVFSFGAHSGGSKAPLLVL